MARANTIITRYRDEVGRSATVTVDIGTDPADDNYGPAQLVTDNPAKVAKIDDTSGRWKLAYGAKQPIRFVGGPLHSNIDGGLDVVIQGGNGGSPDVEFEVPITMPAPFSAGTTRMWPVQPWIDLATVTPTIGVYDPLGFENWFLYVRGVNSQNLQVGGLKLYSQYYVFESDIREGYARSQRKPIIEHRTAFEVSTIYTRGTTRWAAEGDLLTRSSQASDLEDHWFDVDGRALPFCVVPNALRNVVRFVRYDGIAFKETVEFHNQTEDDELVGIRFAVEEVGRGLRPGGAI